MVKIAGIERRGQISGRLIQATPVEEIGYTSHVRIPEYDGTIRPFEELYTRDQVIEILRRFDFFKNRYNEMVEKEGRDRAIRRAKHMLKYNYAGSDWRGIDEFIGSDIAEY